MPPLASWNDTATREAIEAYVEAATGDRVAVFDNDGTLWCEKPMPIQLDFTLRHWAAMAEHEPRCARASRSRPPTSRTTAGSGPRWPSTTRATTAT